MNSPGAKFLHDRNQNLHASQEVEVVVDYLRAYGEAIPNQPTDKISAYLGFLGSKDYVNDGILTGDRESLERQIVRAIILQPSEIPEGYFELQRRIAREQGHGDVKVTDGMRAEAARVIGGDQEHSLQNWADYLSSRDARFPDWFKLYAFEGVSKLGKFDKEKGEFQKRSQGTTVPFPELSRGALSQLRSWVQEARLDGKTVIGLHGNLEDQNYDQQKEQKFQKALSSANFGKLYVYALEAVNSGTITLEQKKIIQGSWRAYKQGSDANLLHGDLHGFGLDWCTATGYETAASHLSGGDFYVYYSRDEKGEDRIPRIAIRMKEDSVAEVRGINDGQHLEPEIADIISKRLKDLKGGEEYVVKAEDMKRLTDLDNKISADPSAVLSRDDVRFIYEFDHEIQGFGYDRDPRIDEIRTKRGERDKPELVPLIKEAIKEQLGTAFAGYKTVTRALEGDVLLPRTRNRLVFKRFFARKQKEWQKNGIYDYLAEELVASGAHYTLVATPNMEVSTAQIMRLAWGFRTGRKPLFLMEKRDELYLQYSGKELSGNTDGDPIRLSLIPSRPDNVLTAMTAAEQLQMLRERQKAKPELRLRVPSYLDAVTYWYTLDAQGRELNHYTGAVIRTGIRHFDLEPKEFEGILAQPYSNVDDNEPHSSYAKTSSKFGEARLAVG